MDIISFIPLFLTSSDVYSDFHLLRFPPIEVLRVVFLFQNWLSSHSLLLILRECFGLWPTPTYTRVFTKLHWCAFQVTLGCLRTYTGVPHNLHWSASRLTLEASRVMLGCAYTSTTSSFLNFLSLAWVSDLSWFVIHLMWNSVLHLW